MNPPLSHISAALYWAAYGAPGIPEAKPLRADGLTGMDGSASLTGDLIAAVRSTGLFPSGHAFHFLVDSAAARRANKNVVCHVHSGSLPAGSLARMDNGLLVCSPALVFVQMGSILGRAQLAEFAMMLCGIYASMPHPSEPSPPTRTPAKTPPMRPGCFAGAGVDRGLSPTDVLPRRAQITTTERLADFVETAPSIRGAAQAKAALRYATPRSRSPMETVACLCLTLPHRLGGYGLPKPAMNRPLPASLSPVGNDREYDMVFRRANRIAIVEYQGEAFHRGQRSLHRDAVRSNAVNSSDASLLFLTKQQLFDPAQFHEFALQLHARLGIRFRPTLSDFEHRRQELRRDILVPHMRQV